MEQRLTQSPQMIQAMQVLQLSSVQLEERIDTELLENPLLERKEARVTRAARNDQSTVKGAGDLGGLEALLRRSEGDQGNPTWQRQRGPVEGPDSKHQAMLNTPTAYHSLGESLLTLVALFDLDDRQREMVEYLVFSLDVRGYLPQPLSRAAEECGIEGATLEEFSLLLEELRHATHPGLGALDLRECLLLQVDAMNEEHVLLRALVERHLEDIAANRLPHQFLVDTSCL